MPFRSESEHVREQVRRLDEEAAALGEDRARLVLKIKQQSRLRLRHVGLFAVVLVFGSLGFGFGHVHGSVNMAHLRATQIDEHTKTASDQQQNLLHCLEGTAYSERELMECQNTPPTRAAAEPCRCKLNDPLCTCAFDKGAVLVALGNAQTDINKCFPHPYEAGTFHVRVTFAPGGYVTESSVDSGLTGADKEKLCVVNVLRHLKVPKFSGDNVTVGKSMTHAVR